MSTDQADNDPGEVHDVFVDTVPPQTHDADIVTLPPTVLPEEQTTPTDHASAAVSTQPPPTPVTPQASPNRAVADAHTDAALPQVGDLVGKYQLIRELVRGGMGVVFLARDTRLGRLVAIKFVTLRTQVAKDIFLAEARTTARCVHENIVVIYEADEYHGMPYMVLEYIEGQTLRQVLTEHKRRLAPEETGGLPPVRVVELMAPVLRALECAHQEGIIHRDLKPDNVMLTKAGVVKVLDFGIATKNAAAPGQPPDAPSATPPSDTANDGRTARPEALNEALGPVAGTAPYMSPEQLRGTDEVDQYADMWASGIMLFELLTGRHPMTPLSVAKLGKIADPDIPMPRVHESYADLSRRFSGRQGGRTRPDAIGPKLGALTDRCLIKHRRDRIGSARELLHALEPLMPGSHLVLSEHSNPFAGLAAFQESDADRFFGRDRDIASMVMRVRNQPWVTVVGPSGCGKSSLIRAGVIPTLKRSGEGWESFIIRPGRAPLAALAHLLSQVAFQDTTAITSANAAMSITPLTAPPLQSAGQPAAAYVPHTRADGDTDTVLERLRAEPGYIGTVLRTRAERKLRRIILFIDQFEEVFTMEAEESEREAYFACIAAIADDATSPLRIITSIRADFLSRMTEHRTLTDVVTRSLSFLPPIDGQGLRQALRKPVEAMGYRYEHTAIVDDMVEELERTRGALPLLQFAAAMLWEKRDRDRHLLTQASYDASGGITGILAQHADTVLSGMGAGKRALVRAIFERLVTPERTRAIVSIEELYQLSSDADEIDMLLEQLADARLIVIQVSGNLGDSLHISASPRPSGAVELVHESLIDSWPTLRRWLSENREEAAFLARLRAAAKQWQDGHRPEGLLWRGEPARQARLWYEECGTSVTDGERRFLEAVFALTDRAERRRRKAVYGIIASLLALIAIGALVLIKLQGQNRLIGEQLDEIQHHRGALEETLRREQASRKDAEAAKAEAEAALEAQRRAKAAAEAARRQAEAARRQAEAQAAEVRRALAQTRTARDRASDAERRATAARVAADAAEEAAARKAEKQAIIDRAIGPIKRSSGAQGGDENNDRDDDKQ